MNRPPTRRLEPLKGRRKLRTGLITPRSSPLPTHEGRGVRGGAVMLQRAHTQAVSEKRGAVRGDAHPTTRVGGPTPPDRTTLPWSVLPAELLPLYQVQLTQRESEQE